MDCIFCQILAGKIPAEITYRDEELIVFKDINPQAPTHLLIIPKRHIPSLAQLSTMDLPLIGHMVAVATNIAKDIADTGYRLVVNNGEWGGQVVPHLHMHLLGGRKLASRLG